MSLKYIYEPLNNLNIVVCDGCHVSFMALPVMCKHTSSFTYTVGWECKTYTMCEQSLITTAVNHSLDHFESYVTELLHRKDYSTETWPELNCLFSTVCLLEEFSIKKPSESEMSWLFEYERVQTSANMIHI